jgi:EAL domain-containing protein (putative c-di-GMP-specific phosphodiesterase class I)
MRSRVLIVEDDPLQRRVLRQRLTALGVAEVLEAGDGHSAIAMLGSDSRIELILSDLDMPGCDGIDLLCEVGQMKHPAAFAFHSAMDADLLACTELLARERQINFVGFVTKPASNEAIGALMARESSFARPSPRAPAPRVDSEELLTGLAGQQFVAFLQPKVHLTSGRCVGAEALVRWQHPSRGVLAPGLFLPDIERVGLDRMLTISMVREVLAFLRAWGREAVPVAINLSLAFLSERGVADTLLALVRDSDVPSRLVRFEITETVAMSDVGNCLENIARLRLRGHPFSIDDFGVGYSSLEQLIRIPVDEIKLDRSFVSGVLPGSRAALAVEAVVHMAATMRITCVAEGVESATEARYLQGLGCELGQGYFFARPMSGEAFRAWHAGDSDSLRGETSP